ncbi:hypothetical protein Baya_15575 [Bagarius yarrelli]|uniref:Uncharacterized protein n=1 Tax=Bagarius yarrelli TaxID=175774 RepID=A0A556VC19_BAGYA|nr:hypothetical protein Baya_15575 [Bagarius yarrelli]
MGCASAKQVSAVPGEDEGRGKAYSNGDVYSVSRPPTYRKKFASYITQEIISPANGGNLFFFFFAFLKADWRCVLFKALTLLPCEEFSPTAVRRAV